MQTVLENLKERADRLRELISQLMARSSIHLEPTRPEPSFYVVGGYFWRDLPPEGKQLQSRAWEEYRRYHGVMTVLLKDQPEKTLRELKDADHILRVAIQQTGSPRKGMPQAVYFYCVCQDRWLNRRGGKRLCRRQ